MGVGLGADGIRLRAKLRRESRDGMLVGALVLLLIVVFGGSIVKPLCASRTAPNPKMTAFREAHVGNACGDRTGRNFEVEFYGVADGIPIVLSHGWGLHAAEWNYLKRELTVRHLLEIQREPLSVSA